MRQFHWGMDRILLLVTALEFVRGCRWRLFFSSVREALASDTPLDEEAFRQALLHQAPCPPQLPTVFSAASLALQILHALVLCVCCTGARCTQVQLHVCKCENTSKRAHLNILSLLLGRMIVFLGITLYHL